MNIIGVKNLTKNYGSLTAIDDISFAVLKGEIFGFFGPNGAGKSTTISILATLIKADSGEAAVNNFNVRTRRNDVRKSIGLVFPPAFASAKGRWNLGIFCKKCDNFVCTKN